MGYTRKVLEKTTERVSQEMLDLYFQMEPPGGVFGVPRERLIDVDETGVWLAVIRRKYGHAIKGEKAGTVAPYNVGKKYTAILAIDIHGVVAYLILDVPGTTNVLFFHFVCELLLPDITPPDGEPVVRRVILLDNLAAHHYAPMLNAIRTAGHAHTHRPAYASVELGSIELAMGVLKGDLQQRWHHVTADNLVDEVEDAICRIRADQCAGFFRHTGH